MKCNAPENSRIFGSIRTSFIIVDFTITSKQHILEEIYLRTETQPDNLMYLCKFFLRKCKIKIQ